MPPPTSCAPAASCCPHDATAISTANRGQHVRLEQATHQDAHSCMIARGGIRGGQEAAWVNHPGMILQQRFIVLRSSPPTPRVALQWLPSNMCRSCSAYSMACATTLLAYIRNDLSIGSQHSTSWGTVQSCSLHGNDRTDETCRELTSADIYAATHIDPLLQHCYKQVQQS